jgi:hypothetical protein
MKQPLGPVGAVNTVNRSRLFNDDEEDVDADIRALMSRRDILADMVPWEVVENSTWDTLKKKRNDANMPPLLLLYPINAESAPTRASEDETKGRQNLGAVDDVLGIGLVFPSIKGGAATYISVDLPETEHEDFTDADLEPVLAAPVGGGL